MTKNELHAELRITHSARYLICARGFCLNYETWGPGADASDLHEQLEEKGWRFKTEYGGWICKGCRVLVKPKKAKADARKESPFLSPA